MKRIQYDEVFTDATKISRTYFSRHRLKPEVEKAHGGAIFATGK